jgi:hypothetical protein
VAVVYSLLLLTKDIQEDAFITFRVAFNLASHGVFSFNLDERYCSTTSFLYPVLVALARLTCGSLALPVVQAINACSVLAICWLLSKMVSDFFNIAKSQQVVIWSLMALMPHTLVLAVRSMEMQYVVLLFVAGLRALQTGSCRWNAGWPIVVLPFVRPDAVAFSLILAGVAFMMRRSLGLLYMLLAAIGYLSYTALHYGVFGRLLPDTIMAKITSYQVLSIDTILSNWASVMNEVAFPVDVKYLYAIKPFCGITAFVAIGLLLWQTWNKKREQTPILLGTAAAIFGVSSAYSFGSVVFPWYLWPSQILCASILLGGLISMIGSMERATFRKMCWGFVALMVLSMMSLQLMRSYNWGVMESVYRASIGKYIAEASKEGDTLFLEPAGYIPFYARLKTLDEIGLTSPIVGRYMREYPENWWSICVREQTPTFIVQREQFDKYITHHGYVLTADEIVWFNKNYVRLNTFHYVPEEYTHYPFLLKLLM